MSNLIFRELNNQLILIKTNNKYPDGTCIEIYLKNFNNNLILTDLGFTFLWLLNLGLKIKDSDKFNFMIKNNVQNFYFSGGELSIKIDNNLDCIDNKIKMLTHICNDFISFILNGAENEP